MGPAAPGRVPDSVRRGGGWQGIRRWAGARGGCQVSAQGALLRAPPQVATEFGRAITPPPHPPPPSAGLPLPPGPSLTGLAGNSKDSLFPSCLEMTFPFTVLFIN